MSNADLPVLRVLFACERSGIGRNARKRYGHDAFSCDLEEEEQSRPDGWDGYYRGDVLELLDDRAYTWDMVIAHTPCTYLCNSGVKHMYDSGKKLAVGNTWNWNKERWENMNKAADFYAAVYHKSKARGVKHIAMENPIMHRYALDALWLRGVPPQTSFVHPWQHGHLEMKTLGFLLEGLPPLVPTLNVGPPPADKKAREAWARVHRMPPGPDRARKRSQSYEGISEAMALQWGTFVANCLTRGY